MESQNDPNGQVVVETPDRRPPRMRRILAASALGLSLILAATGCTKVIAGGPGSYAKGSATPTPEPTDEPPPTDEPTGSTPDLPSGPEAPYPTTAEELETYIVDVAPAGLAQVPNGNANPPAGPSTIEDVAGQFADADEMQTTLEEIGYWQGYRRVWGDTTTGLTVYVDQFLISSGASDFVQMISPSYGEGVGAAMAPLDNAPGCQWASGVDPDNATVTTTHVTCNRKVWSIDVTATSPDPAQSQTLGIQLAQDQYGKLP